MTGAEAAATTGAAGASGVSLGMVFGQALGQTSGPVAAVISVGFAALGVVLIAVAIRLGRVDEARPVSSIVVKPSGLDDLAPEVLFEAFQRALRRAGRSL